MLHNLLDGGNCFKCVSISCVRRQCTCAMHPSFLHHINKNKREGKRMNKLSITPRVFVRNVILSDREQLQLTVVVADVFVAVEVVGEKASEQGWQW